MIKIGEYRNGNYNVAIYNDGTKIRETFEDEFVADFPECMDVKITNYCDMNCPYCHENSTTEGKHGDILNPSFINSLKPYTETAIGGGNPLSHPDLVEFLKKLKSKRIIANITVNQKHFMDNVLLLRMLAKEKLIYGLGVSYNYYDEMFEENFACFDNAVLHVINGIVRHSDMRKLYGKGFKILILGYKQFRKGSDYYCQSVDDRKQITYDKLPEYVQNFKVVSFDNLAIKQLQTKRLMSEEDWNEFYMGDDGQFTMYVDLVKQKFARNSTSDVRYDLLDDIVDMFKVVKGE